MDIANNHSLVVASTPMSPSPSPILPPAARRIVRKAVARPTVVSTGLEQHAAASVITSAHTPPAFDPIRRSSVENSYSRQQSSQTYVSGLHGTNTNTSIASSSPAGSLLSCNALLSPLTDITIQSPLASPLETEKILSQDHATHRDLSALFYLTLCAHCNRAIPQPHPPIQCLICTSTDQSSVISSLCFPCYAIGAQRFGHNHHISFFACDSDSAVPGSKMSNEVWIVRRNSSKRLWYEHKITGYRTWVKPMSAVCELPSGWEQRRDPEGHTYFENKITCEMSRTPPNNLPSGWRESKDPDGRLFFVYPELQLASWCRPGQQPQAQKTSQDAKPRKLSINTTSRSPVRAGSRTLASRKAEPISVLSNRVRVRPPPSVQEQRQMVEAQQLVTLGSITSAAINLLDPTNGGFGKNSKVVGHFANQGVKGTIKAAKQNKRLNSIVSVRRQVKTAWQNAAKEVESLDNSFDDSLNALLKKGTKPTQTGCRGQESIAKGANDGYGGEYVVEYDDGTLEYYDSSGLIRSTSIAALPRPSLPQRSSQSQSSSQLQHPPQHALVEAMDVQRFEAQAPVVQRAATLPSAAQPSSARRPVIQSSASHRPAVHRPAVQTSATHQPVHYRPNHDAHVQLDKPIVPGPAIQVQYEPTADQNIESGQTTNADQAATFTIQQDDHPAFNVDPRVDQNVGMDQEYQALQDHLSQYRIKPDELTQNQTLVVQNAGYELVYNVREDGTVDVDYVTQEDVDCDGQENVVYEVRGDDVVNVDYEAQEDVDIDVGVQEGESGDVDYDVQNKQEDDTVNSDYNKPNYDSAQEENGVDVECEARTVHGSASDPGFNH